MLTLPLCCVPGLSCRDLQLWWTPSTHREGRGTDVDVEIPGRMHPLPPSKFTAIDPPWWRERTPGGTQARRPRQDMQQRMDRRKLQRVSGLEWFGKAGYAGGQENLIIAIAARLRRDPLPADPAVARAREPASC